MIRKSVVGLLLGVGLMVMPTFAQEATAEATQEMAMGTIADIVVASATGETPEFATLLAAVQAADPLVLEALSNPAASLTVFAPTDAAFAALQETLGDEGFNAVLASPEDLTDILLYHVVGSRLASSDVVTALDALTTVQEAWGLTTPIASIETLNGQSLDIAYNETGDGILVDQANLVLEMVDIQASNGVIHVIDAVLLPETRTIADIVVAASSAETPEFGTLLAAVSAADASVLALLSDPEAELTVFAPTDAAFAALQEALGADAFSAILADPAQLTAILQYHVLVANVSSTDLTLATNPDMMMDTEMPAWNGGLNEDGALVLNTANGATLTFSINPETGILLNDTVRIVATDIDASNGVIHVIDAVLVPAGE